MGLLKLFGIDRSEVFCSHGYARARGKPFPGYTIYPNDFLIIKGET